MTIRALYILFITFILPSFAAASSGSEQFMQCTMPVVEYTTGEMDDNPEWFYSDSVEWVIESYFPHPNAHGMPGYEGWIVLIRMIADGDEDLEDHIMRDDGLAQVKVDGVWMLQYDFERILCDTLA